INDLKRSKSQRNREVLTAWRYLRKNRNNFDLVHNFGRLIYLLPILNHPVKKIMTYGRRIAASGIRMMNRLPNKNIIYTAPSQYCANTGNAAGKWAVVPNAIDFSKYSVTLSVPANAPLVFLSRLDAIKG